MFLRSQFNYDGDAVSRETALTMVNPVTGEIDEGLTQQEFKTETDINEIVRRFGLTGEMPDVWNAPQSGDFVEAMDYKSAMDAVTNARSSFMELPAEMRARFDNDPQKLMLFLENDKNRDEAIKLGLVKEAVVPPRDMVKAIDELAGKLVPPKP